MRRAWFRLPPSDKAVLVVTFALVMALGIAATRITRCVADLPLPSRLELKGALR